MFQEADWSKGVHSTLERSGAFKPDSATANHDEESDRIQLALLSG